MFFFFFFFSKKIALTVECQPVRNAHPPTVVRGLA